jgi:hypothetical protein
MQGGRAAKNEAMGSILMERQYYVVIICVTTTLSVCQAVLADAPRARIRAVYRYDRRSGQPSGYDNAQVCANGHVITQFANTRPQHIKKFCDKCGAATMRACPKCATEIQGSYHVPGAPSATKKEPPAFCHNCGGAYPWTEQRLVTARQFADEEAQFSAEERQEFQQSLDELVKQTNSPLAASRFKRLLAKSGRVVSDGLHDILVDVLSEAVKKAIWPT